MLLGTLGTGLLGNMLAGKNVLRAGKGTFKARLNSQCCLIF